MSCNPPYSYRPEAFVAGAQKCSAPKFPEHRARTDTIFEPPLVPGDPSTTGIYVRSRGFGFDKNLISIETVTSVNTPPEIPGPVAPFTFIVRFDGEIVEYYKSTDYPFISSLRTATDTANSLIELPPILIDTKDDQRIAESLNMFEFAERTLRGGSGGPEDDATLKQIRTGPERSIIIISSTEDYTGASINPPAARRVQQWNGFRWITYSNSVPGACPFNGISSL